MTAKRINNENYYCTGLFQRERQRQPLRPGDKSGLYLYFPAGGVRLPTDRSLAWARLYARASGAVRAATPRRRGKCLIIRQRRRRLYPFELFHVPIAPRVTRTGGLLQQNRLNRSPSKQNITVLAV